MKDAKTLLSTYLLFVVHHSDVYQAKGLGLTLSLGFKIFLDLPNHYQSRLTPGTRISVDG